MNKNIPIPELQSRQDSFSLDVRWGTCDHVIRAKVTPEWRESLSTESFEPFWFLPVRVPAVKIIQVSNDWDGVMELNAFGLQSYVVIQDTRKVPPYNLGIKLTGITSIRPEYHIVYLVDKAQCPRCQNLEYLKDLSINSLNYFSITSGKFKLAMDIEKMIVTDRFRSYYSWYGTKIVQMSKEKFLPMVMSRVVEDIYNCLDNIQRIQNLRRHSNQVLPDNEVYSAIVGFNVQPNMTDIDITLKINTLSADKFSVSVPMTIT